MIIKTKTNGQYVRYSYYRENLNWAAQTFVWTACDPGFDIAELQQQILICFASSVVILK